MAARSRLEKLGPTQSPVIKTLLDHAGGETISRRLQRRPTGHLQKRIVVLAERHLLAVQFPLVYFAGQATFLLCLDRIILVLVHQTNRVYTH